MAPIEEIIEQAEQDRASAHRWARSDHNLYFVVGVLAVAAGVLAGGSGLADSQKLITALAGFAAALLAGIQTVARAEERSRFHYKKWADFGEVVLDGRILADRKQPPPSDEELRALAKRLTEIEGRVFGGEPAQAGA